MAQIRFKPYLVVAVATMLSLIIACVMQYHHHGENLYNESICLCLNPAHHCAKHEHGQAQDDHQCHSSANHNQQGHKDPSFCSIHIGQVVIQDDVRIDSPSICTLLACMVVQFELLLNDRHLGCQQCQYLLLSYQQPQCKIYGLRAPPVGNFINR